MTDDSIRSRLQQLIDRGVSTRAIVMYERGPRTWGCNPSWVKVSGLAALLKYDAGPSCDAPVKEIIQAALTREATLIAALQPNGER